MALVVAGAFSRPSMFIESAKLLAINRKSFLRPQGKAFIFPSATMVTKAFQEPGFLKKPWDYKKKGYNQFYYLYEKTLPKFNENTKVIVVEGPIASGKTTLAKQIAEDFDLHYFPEPTCDQLFTNEYGFNYRELNPQLPPHARFINKEDFYLEPTMRNATYYIANLFQQSFMHYIQALAHLLNTGQGIVLDRSYFSNIVDMLTLVECGYVRPEFKNYHNDTCFILSTHILKPHLIVYLDVSVDTVKQRIKNRGIDYEVESTVLNTKYLSLMEKFYKDKFLEDMSPHCELLVYDWTDFGDAEVVVEDIEQIDFDKYGKYDMKLDDWRKDREKQWGSLRILLTNHQDEYFNMFNLGHHDIPEMFMSFEDSQARKEAMLSHPTEKYAYGFNAHLGDKNILFKQNYPGWKNNGIPFE